MIVFQARALASLAISLHFIQMIVSLLLEFPRLFLQRASAFLVAALIVEAIEFSVETRSEVFCGFPRIPACALASISVESQIIHLIPRFIIVVFASELTPGITISFRLMVPLSS